MYRLIRSITDDELGVLAVIGLLSFFVSIVGSNGFRAMF